MDNTGWEKGQMYRSIRPRNKNTGREAINQGLSGRLPLLTLMDMSFLIFDDNLSLQ